MAKIFKLIDLRKNKALSQNKKLVIFDLDGTLTKSKRALESTTAKLLGELLRKNKIAVIGGGKYEIFQTQFLKKLKVNKNLFRNLFLFPTNASVFYRYNRGWQRVYFRQFSESQKKQVKWAILKALLKARFQMPEKIYGSQIEDRGSQVTFSALGQKAPLRLKQKWHQKNDNRQKIMKFLRGYLSGFEVREGGLTSIDVNAKGIDKAYGVRKISRILRVSKQQILFVGDALFPGGNDYPALKAGVTCLKVKDPKETKKLIKALIC